MTRPTFTDAFDPGAFYAGPNDSPFRDITAELVAQLNSQSVRYAFFVELFFDDGVFRAHQAVGTLTTTEAGGTPRVWYGVGDLGTVDAIRENIDLKSGELELILSGLDSVLTNEALNAQVSNRVAKLFIGAFDTNDQLDGNLSFLWRGRMDRMRTYFGDDTNTVHVICEGEAASLLRTRFGYFSNDMQQRRFPGDIGLEYLAQIPFRQIVWAGKSVGNTGAAPGPFIGVSHWPG